MTCAAPWHSKPYPCHPGEPRHCSPAVMHWEHCHSRQNGEHRGGVTCNSITNHLKGKEVQGTQGQASAIFLQPRALAAGEG